MVGPASVQVTEPVLDHFTFDPIPNPRYAGLAFPISITAQDSLGHVAVTYTGQPVLSAGASEVQVSGPQASRRGAGAAMSRSISRQLG